MHAVSKQANNGSKLIIKTMKHC